MIIKGLEDSRYYLFNPIWVDVTDAPSKIRFNVEIDGVSNHFDLFSFNGKLRFDIGKLVLGLIDNISNKDSIIGLMDGWYRVNLKIVGFSTSGATIGQDSSKYFLLGGVKGYESNVTAPTNLSLTNKIWEGYPQWKSVFQGGILNQTDHDFDVLKPRLSCNNIFIIFRNNLGGFSAYLFEDFKINDTNKNKGYYLTQRSIKIPGVDASSGISVTSKVHRDFYETLRHLADSFEIYAYNDGIFDTSKTLIRLNGANNKVSFNEKDIATEVSMNFDLVTNFNKVW